MNEVVVRDQESVMGKTLGERKRSVEILGVFAAHNFYANGFTPEELRMTLEDLGPTYVKIGQILSSRTDILPEEFCHELERLRGDVSPLPAAVVRGVIERECGRRIEEVFDEFCDEPLGSASIAQAHYGVLKDGTRVVTKVQRPDVADKMRRDFVLLRKLANLVGVVSGEDEDAGTIDLVEVIAELEKVTEEELDFHVEADHTRDFREHCIEDPKVISCPEIIDELTTERILTMTYVDGYSLSHADRLDEDGYDRERIAEAIVTNYLHQVLDVGTFHGDPHQGNIMISNGIPYWIDFGMIGHVDERSVDALQAVVMALISKDAEALADAALALGTPRGRLDKGRLVEDVDILIDRYATIGNLQDLDLGALMSDLTNLMEEHRISMPGDYTMLVRGLVTIEGVIEELCPQMDVFGMLTTKFIERARASLDITSKLMEELESLATSGLRATKLPSLTFEVLRNLSKGRMKVGVEPTGYEELSQRIGNAVECLIEAAFACVLFQGSCTLCTTDIAPVTNGVPLVALIGFVVSISLGIFALRHLHRR